MSRAGFRVPSRPVAPEAQPYLRASALAAVFALGLALRLLYVLSIRRAYFFDHLQDEPLRYHEWAVLILEAPSPPGPPFDQAPGYPYFVAAVYRAFGRGVAPVAFVQAVVDAASCALLALVGDRSFGRRVGAIAGVIAAIYGPFIYFVGELEPATTFLAAMLAAMAAAVVARGVRSGERPPRAGSWIGAAGLWIVALIVRAEAVLAFPVVVLDAWLRGGRRALWRTAVPLAVALAAIAAVNVARSGDLVFLTTTGGLNLWLGNNPAADGVNCFVSGPVQSVFADVTSQARDAAEADARFRQRALAFWRSEPARGAALLGKKLLWTFNDRELPNTGDIEWQTAHSWLFRLPMVPPGFGVVLPLALAGVVALGRDRRKALLLLAPVTIGVGVSVLLFTNARFRVPMVPALILLAAIALDRLPPLLRDRRRHGRTLLGMAGAAAVGIVLAWGDFGGVRTYRIPQITVNTGILERGAGDLDAAVRDLRAGLVATPHDGLAWTHLALALEQQGRLADALDACLDGIAADPADPALASTAMGFLRRHEVDPSLLRGYREAATVEAREAAAAKLRNDLRRRERNTP